MVKKAENMNKAELIQSKSDLEREKRELELRIAELEKANEPTMDVDAGHPVEPEPSHESYPDEDFINIRPDTYVRVISLCPHPLNLRTALNGGKNFRFRKLGDEKRIIYADVVDMIETHPNFTENGVFYIADKRVVRRHGLDDFYDKIIAKEEIEEIMNTSADKALLIFKSANTKQKTYLSEMLIKKIVAGEEVDMNFVHMVVQDLGVDIAKKAEDSKDFKEALSKQE